MSKLVKGYMTEDVKNRLKGVESLFVVNVVGLNSLHTANLRRELRKQNVRLLVVKNSVARRATEGSVLAPAFDGLSGSSAVAWGGEDIVSLAKTIIGLSEKKEFEKLQIRGGVIDGGKLSEADVKAVSKWPSRQEQLSIIAGQILGPGSRLAAALLGPGGTVAGQIKSKGEGGDEPAAAE